MRAYRPTFPFNVTIELLKPIYTTKKGVTVKTYGDTGDKVKCSFRTFGGTETLNNDVYTIVDTAVVETWYRKDLKSDCRIKVLQTNKIYEIFGDVENINMRNQFAKFKVRAVQGGA